MPDARPIIAATPANGYVVHAARQPADDALFNEWSNVYRGITLCGVRGRDANRWGGLRPWPEPRTEWQPFRVDLAPDDRRVAHPICRSCVRRFERITAEEANRA